LGCLKWQSQTDGEVAGSVTVGMDNRVHVACEGGELYTLDANGALLWSHDTNSPLLSSPTIGPDGTVYVGSEDGTLFAIDIDGGLRWTHTAADFIYASPAVSADGDTVFVGSGDGVLYALGRDGSELWSFQTTGFGEAAPAIYASPAIGRDGTVYLGAFSDANLYALDPNDANVKWVCHFEYPVKITKPYWGTKFGSLAASPVVAPDGTIYQKLLNDPNLYAIDPNNGAVLWSVDVFRPPCPDPSLASCYYKDPGGSSEPLVGPDGTIYALFNGPCGPVFPPGGYDDWVPWRCLAATDPNGAIKWSVPLGAGGEYTLTAGNDGLVYAAGSDGYLLVIDANGRELARLPNDTGLAFPVVASDGAVLVSDGDGRVMAIGSDDCTGKILALHRLEDLDGSGAVSFADFALLALDWTLCTNQDPLSWETDCDYQGEEIHLLADVDRNLYVDWLDVKTLANRWLAGE
jgi:outer membrane protein assembly factor BamB